MRGFPREQWRASTGIDNKYRFFDHFCGNAMQPEWIKSYGTTAFLDNTTGILRMSQNVSTLVYWTIHNFYRAANPVFETRLYCDSIAKGWSIWLENGGWASGFGVGFNPAASNKIRILANDGGGEHATESSVVCAISTWYTLRCWIAGTVGAQTINLTINGTNLTQELTHQPTASYMRPALWTEAGAAGGTYLSVDWYGVEADFGTTPA